MEDTTLNNNSNNNNNKSQVIQIIDRNDNDNNEIEIQKEEKENKQMENNKQFEEQEDEDDGSEDVDFHTIEMNDIYQNHLTPKLHKSVPNLPSSNNNTGFHKNEKHSSSLFQKSTENPPINNNNNNDNNNIIDDNKNNNTERSVLNNNIEKQEIQESPEMPSKHHMLISRTPTRKSSTASGVLDLSPNLFHPQRLDQTHPHHHHKRHQKYNKRNNNNITNSNNDNYKHHNIFSHFRRHSISSNSNNVSTIESNNNINNNTTGGGYNGNYNAHNNLFGTGIPYFFSPYGRKFKNSVFGRNLIKFFKKYPWRVFQFIFKPRSPYTSKILERRCYILILLTIAMFVVFILSTILHSEIWYVFAPGILATIIIFVIAKFTGYYYLGSFLLIGVSTAINVTSIILFVARGERTTKVIFIWDVLVLICAALLVPSVLPCIGLLVLVSLSYIGMGIYINAKSGYTLVDDYDSFQDELRTIIIAFLLLTIYSILTCIDLREIERKEARIQSLFKISNEALIVHKDGIITDANPAFESMFQTKVQDLIYPIQSGIWEFLPDLEPLFKNHDFDVDVIETVANDASGRSFQVEVRSNKANYAGQNVDVLSIIDITGRKQLMEADFALRKAEAANEAKVTFLTTVSHELRTPITGILSSVELIERNPGSLEEFLGYIKISAQLLNDLINDILDYSKIEAGKLVIMKFDFSLLKMIEDTVKIISIKIIEKKLEFCIMIDDNVPLLIKGDSNRVKQILLNFLSNSVKFTSEGQIIVRVKMAPKQPTTTQHSYASRKVVLLFEVEDSGIGIREEDLNLLFTAFSQIDSGNSRRYQGTGLGLSISKRLCLMMGGNVFVRSKFGVGSTFSFTVEFEEVSEQAFRNYTLKFIVSTIYGSEIFPTMDICRIVGKKRYSTGVVGIVVYSNSAVRESIAQILSLLNITCLKFTNESELREYIKNLDQRSSSSVYLVLTDSLEINSDTISTPEKFQFNWVYLSDSYRDTLQPGFQFQVTKPCLFEDILQLLYKIPHDNLKYLTDPLSRLDTDNNGTMPTSLNSTSTSRFKITELSENEKKVNTPSPSSSKDYSQISSPTQLYSSPSVISSTSDKLKIIDQKKPTTFVSSPGLIQSTDINRSPSKTTTTTTSVISNNNNEQQNIIMRKSDSDQSPSLESSGSSKRGSKSSSKNNTPKSGGSPLFGKPKYKTTPNTPPKRYTSKVLSTSSSNLANSGKITPPQPSTIPPSQTSKTTHSPQRAPSNITTNKILLVEDNPMISHLLGRSLSTLGYQFSTARNGLEAVEKVKSEPFELVLMDCQMPEMDGLTATKIIRDLEKDNKIQVPERRRRGFLVIIALTAGTSSESRQNCLDAGMNDFLEKPVDYSTLTHMIDRWIRKRDSFTTTPK